jgi:Ion channel
MLITVAAFEDTLWSIAVTVVLTVVIPLGVAGSDFRRNAVVLSTIGAGTAGLLLIAGILVEAPGLLAIGRALFIVLVILTQLIVLADVIRQPEVTVDTILGGVAAYLMLGLGWALIYLILIRFQPDALVDPTGVGVLDLGSATYFSVVTQTTLGYGDIQPNTGAARGIVQLEALIGQLFIAVLVAWIVGRLVSRVSDISGQK